MPSNMSARGPSRRPLATVVVGNGFSIDFAEYLLASELRRVLTTPLVPIPPFIPMCQTEGPNTTTASTLREYVESELPGLFELASSDACSCDDLIKKIGSGRQESGLAGHIASMSGDNISVQLFHYLWYLFKYVEKLIGKTWRTADVMQWHWTKAIQHCLAWFDIVFISYNYDCVLERTITTLTGQEVCTPWSKASEKVLLGSRVPIVLKPHGSIAWNLDALFGLECGDDSSSIDLRDISAPFPEEPGDVVKVSFPPRARPIFPTLVPPGCPGSLAYLRHQSLEKAMSDVLRSTDYLIVCGLNGGGADAEETDELLGKVARSTIVRYVGIDANCHASRVLRARTRNFRFVKARAFARWHLEVLTEMTQSHP